MIGNEFDFPDDELKAEKRSLWAAYTLGGADRLKARLLDLKWGNANIIRRSRSVVSSILGEPNVEGEIREILMGYLLSTDDKV